MTDEELGYQRGWNARGVQDSQPQSPDTCKRGHPVSALRERVQVNSYDMLPADDTVEYCSICAEIEAAVLAERKKWVELLLHLTQSNHEYKPEACTPCGEIDAALKGETNEQK